MALPALDFPASPTVGQLYPDPPVTGQPTYKWDGAQWLAYRASGTPGLTVPAAPFDALAYNGMQINGSMDVSQEKGFGAATTVAGGFICDGWTYLVGGTGLAAQGSCIAVAGLVSGFDHYLQVAVNTAKASLVSGDFVFLVQSMEGVRTARLGWGAAGAKPITIGFWSAHNPAGLYSGSIRNGAAPYRSYVFTYTHTTPYVPQFNVITIPGDAAGTWAVGNATGISLAFTTAEGGMFTSPAPAVSSWVDGNYVAAPGQVNGLSSTANQFRITGVIVLPGIEAPTAAQSPLIMRPYDQELLTCKRYWQSVAWAINGVSGIAGNVGGNAMYPVTMRASPAASPSSTANINAGVTNINSMQPTFLNFYGAVAANTGFVIYCSSNLDARL
jgi:hypothetical protein